MNRRHVLAGMLCMISVTLAGQHLQPVAYEDISIGGELQTRALKNFDRLETDIYMPAKVFPPKHETVSADWPGDYEGRIILGLTLQARATHRTPRYLEELIALIPQKVNAQGYLGPVMQDSILEQQLSGHGWLLRGLCEYYAWKKDPAVKKYITDIIEHLALPTRGAHKIYPIDPKQRVKGGGEAIGTTEMSIGKWKLSSDIGCDFIFMDGVVHAYGVVPSPALKALIDEMVARFLEVDLVGINAQTHATLTGIRALLRYYALTGDQELLKQAEARYLLYRNTAMTENFENYNWFGRPEWTEPCAIVDAYMTANQLWMYTRKPLYMEDAQQTYYNALAHTQRSNGGFGLDNCINDTTRLLQVKAYEAYWCCTMRGGEGLASAIRYQYFTGNNSVYVPVFGNSTATVHVSGGQAVVQQTTTWPLQGNVQFTVQESSATTATEMALFIPSGATKVQLLINGRSVTFTRKQQMAVFQVQLRKGTTVRFTFNMAVRAVPLLAKGSKPTDACKFQYGPLLLGYTTASETILHNTPVFTRVSKDTWTSKDKRITLKPVYHLLDPEVNEGTGYSKQVIFRINKQKKQTL